MPNPIKSQPSIAQVDTHTISVTIPQADLVQNYTLDQLMDLAAIYQKSIDDANFHIADCQDKLSQTNALIDQAKTIGIKSQKTP